MFQRLQQAFHKGARDTREYLGATIRQCRTCRACGARVVFLESVCQHCGAANPVEIPPVQCVCLTAIVAELLMLAIWAA